MATFLEACFVLAWMLAIVVAGVGAMVMLSERGSRVGLPLAVLAFLLMAGFLTFISTQDDNAMNACLRSGRAWAIVGNHTELVFNAATKTSLPQQVTDYGCVDRR